MQTTMRMLVCAFVVRCLDSIINPVSISEISRVKLVSVAERAGLSLPWSQTPKTVFLVTRLTKGTTGTSVLHNSQSLYQISRPQFKQFSRWLAVNVKMPNISNGRELRENFTIFFFQTLLRLSTSQLQTVHQISRVYFFFFFFFFFSFSFFFFF